MKAIVQSGKGVAIVPRACVDNEARLGVLKVLALTPKRGVAFSLFRRRQPMSRRKEAFVNRLRQALRD
jgi:DNA-binding transcriptional LysR family regulator